MEIYQITHAYIEGDDNWNVTSPMNPEEFELLLAYLQFEVNEIDEDVSLIPMDMVKRVLPLYGCERTFDDILDDDEHDFDLHWTWESFTGRYDEILKMEKFHHPELKQVLTKLIEEIKAEQKRFEEEREFWEKFNADQKKLDEETKTKLFEETKTKLFEQIEDENGPTLPYVFEEDEYDPMDAMEEAHNDRPCFMDEDEDFPLIRWKNEGAVNMKKCALCNWENTESNETLDEFFNGNKIMDFELCDSHEHDLKAFCEED